MSITALGFEGAIYLDCNATTPCDPRVVEKMLPYFGMVYGNPASSLHRQGRAAARAVDGARQQVASLIGASQGEIFFTSGATESNNLAILGAARLAVGGSRSRIVTCAVEHKAVLAPCSELETAGFVVVVLPVNRGGRVSIESAEKAIDDQTLLVSIQAANNEIGTLQPVGDIGRIAHRHGAWMHCDAAQAVGKIPVSVDQWHVDLLSISAHKAYGPKGTGALYVRGGTRAIPLGPISFGGGHEHDLRPGTLNVPGIVGLGEACRIAGEALADEPSRVAELRDLLERNLLAWIPGLRVNGNHPERLPNTSSLTLPGIDVDALLLNLPGVMLGIGSACTSGAIEPSHVLQAIGMRREDAFSTVRASLGRFTTEAEIRKASKLVAEAWAQLVNVSSHDDS